MSVSMNYPSKSSMSTSESLKEECESLWLLVGPPFDPRDYLMSPSESDSVLPNNSPSVHETKKKLTPGDIKIDSKYILNSSKSLAKVVQIIRSGDAKTALGRINSLVKKFLDGSPLGFLYSDLPLVVEAVEFFARNYSTVPEYLKFLKMFMNYIIEPPKITKTSDLLFCKENVTDYFTLFAELLVTLHDVNFQLYLLKSINSLLTRSKLWDVSCVTLKICLEAMEDSQLPFVVSSVLETVSLFLYPYYLELVLNMMLGSWKAGIIMAQNNALNFICIRLNPFSYEDSENLPLDSLDMCEREDELIKYYEMLDKSGYIIWGLLAIISKENIEVPCPGEKALWSLRYVIVRELRRRCQRADDIRNNLAGIIIKMLAVFGEQLPTVQTGVAGSIVKFATCMDIKYDKPYVHEFHYRTTNEDFTLKKLMLLGCCLLSKCKNAIELLKYEKVIPGVLQLLDYNKGTSPWKPNQFMSLFLLALRTLSEIVPYLPEEFLLHDGIARVLGVLKWFMEDHFDLDFLLEALKTLTSAVSCEQSKCVIDDIKAQNGVEFLLELCTYLLDRPSLKLKHQYELSRVFLILEKLFGNDPKTQYNFAENCVKISIKMLKRILANSKNDSKLSPKVFITFGGFLWEAVAWCSKALKLFIDHGGIFLLLDFIEISTLPIQMFYLGVLVDMTEEGETIAHLLTWRGNNGIGVMVMMVNIWKKEENLNRVPKAKNGVILDTTAPLMTAEQWYLTYQVREAHIYSPSIAEMFCSARPKIHALYQFLHNRYYDKIQIAEETYKLQLKTMGPCHMVYIPLFEHYLALKMSEIWYEVMRDAKVSGVFLPSFNGDMLFKLIDEKNKWATRIRTMQEEIHIIHEGNDASEEKNLYSLLKSCRLACSLEALRELDYITRTSNYEYLKKKKEMQISDLENSAICLPNIQEVHRTYLSKTNVTILNYDYVWLKSEKETVESDDLLVPPSANISVDNCVEFSENISI